MQFNPTVHCADEHGDPIRNDDGKLRLKPNWKDAARDHMGRKFNSRIHGGTPELNESGELQIQRRDEARKPMTATQKVTDFVNSHREEGYEYRLVNDEGGRIETFQKHDWEPVMGENGVARMPVGQAKSAGAEGVLMKKPKEWYDEDQQEKDRLLNAHIDSIAEPKDGQYSPTNEKGEKETKLR